MTFLRQHRFKSAGALLCMTSTLALTAGAIAQDEPAEDEPVDQLVVTGVRGQARTVESSAVPIDVFGAEDMDKVSFTDTNDILKTLVPSYTLTRQPISDGGTFIRPANLRGLPTDKTLVLVNSKRRHRAALVSIGGSGTQGPDIATIPAVALKSVEVLRDGAASQYGSDAIAGVMNFLLKDNAEGVEITAQAGQFYEGDGEDFVVAANAGFALGSEGFLSLSAEISSANRTDRSEQYCESWFCLDEYVKTADDSYIIGVADTYGDTNVQKWGQPEADAIRTFFNAGLPVGELGELYGYGNYSSSESTGGFYYRYPNNGTIEDLRLEDGSVYSPLEIFPGGFTPAFSGDVIDYSSVFGFRGDAGSLSYDLAGRFGHSEIQYTIENTINPSLGPDTPTKFRPGDLINEEAQLQADFVYSTDVGLAEDLVIAFGASYMDETYELVGGDEASYEAGPFATSDPFGFCNDDGTPTDAGSALPTSAGLDCADEDDPVYTVVGVGSNGFPGFSEEYSGVYERDSVAVYVESSADVTDKLFLQAALRYESYSDFDPETTYKLAGRYEVLPGIGLRASYGTGFRAPTPGQQGTTNVSTRLPNGIPVATGLFPASSAVAQALGATPLLPETSVNYTAGITAATSVFDVTVDMYRIELTDRVNAISTITIVDDCNTDTDVIDTDCPGYRGNLIDAGVVGAESIGGVFYFTNAFDSVTQGVDVVLTSDFDFGSMGTLDVTAAVNYNESDFNGYVDELFNAESQFDFVNGLPNTRGAFTFIHELGDIQTLLRLNYTGEYKNSNGGSTVTQVQKFSPELFTDVEVTWQATDTASVSLGVRNLFDEYPDPGEIGETCCGRIYRSDSVVDWHGGYYYASLRAKF